MTLVLTEKRDGVALVTMNRPDAMNALSTALRDELAATIEALEADADTRVLILTGAGTRAFTAGLDLKELGQADGAALSGGARDPVRALANFSGPTIAAVNGVAITGGFELALACDVLIGSPNARFADTHARVGILPGWGLSQRLSRLLGPRAPRRYRSPAILSMRTGMRLGSAQPHCARRRTHRAGLCLAEDMFPVCPMRWCNTKP